jgi:hypothetical protein
MSRLKPPEPDVPVYADEGEDESLSPVDQFRFAVSYAAEVAKGSPVRKLLLDALEKFDAATAEEEPDPEAPEACPRHPSGVSIARTPTAKHRADSHCTDVAKPCIFACGFRFPAESIPECFDCGKPGDASCNLCYKAFCNACLERPDEDCCSKTEADRLARTPKA